MSYPRIHSARYSIFLGVVVACIAVGLLFQGCASTGESVTTSYSESSDQSKYETNPIRITRGGSGLGSSGQQIIYVKAQADCDGRACTPESVRILLSSGTRNVSWLDYDDVTISSDNWSRTWTNVSTREDPELIGIGEFMRLSLPIGEFRRLLQSQGMSIQVGGTDINLSFGQMERFRDMMVIMDPEAYDDSEDVLEDDPAANDDDVV